MIDVKPQELENAAQIIEAAASNLQLAIDEVDAEFIKQNAEVFAGNRADALRTRYLAQQASLQEFSPFLRQFSQMLQVAAEAFRQADTSNQGLA